MNIMGKTLAVAAVALAASVAFGKQDTSSEVDLSTLDFKYTRHGCVKDVETGRYHMLMILLDAQRREVHKIFLTPTPEECEFQLKWLPDIDSNGGHSNATLVEELEMKAYRAVAAEVLKIEKAAADAAGKVPSDDETRSHVKKVVEFVQKMILTNSRDEHELIEWCMSVLIDARMWATNVYEKMVKKGEEIPFKTYMTNPLPKGAPSKRVVVPLSRHDGKSRRRIVECELNGRKCRMLVDTGSTTTVVYESFAKKFLDGVKLEKDKDDAGMISNVKSSLARAELTSFKVGDADFGAFKIGSIPGNKGDVEDGILGMDVLGRVPTLLSLGGNKLVFNPSDEDTAGFGKPERLRGRNCLVSKIGVMWGKTPLFALIDTGSVDSTANPSVNWPAKTGEERAVTVRDVNGVHQGTSRVGAEDTVDVGGITIPVHPNLREYAPYRFVIGANDIAKCDMLIKDGAFSFRNASPAKDEEQEPSAKEEPSVKEEPCPSPDDVDLETIEYSKVRVVHREDNESGRYIEVVDLLDEDSVLLCEIVVTPTAEECKFQRKWLPDVNSYAFGAEELEMKVYMALAAEVLKLEKENAAGGKMPSEDKLKRHIKKVVQYVQMERNIASLDQKALFSSLVKAYLHSRSVARDAYDKVCKDGKKFTREYRAANDLPKGAPSKRVVVTLSREGGKSRRRIVECELDGQKCRMLIDTGASASAVSKDFVERCLGEERLKKPARSKSAKRSSNIRVETYRVALASFKVGGADFGEFRICSFQLGRKGYDGILGMDVLGRIPTLLSLGGDKLVFNPDDDDVAGFGKPERLRGITPLVSKVGAKWGKTPLFALIDTGANESGAIRTVNWPLVSEEPFTMRIRDANGIHEEKTWRGAKGDISLGGVKLSVSPLLTELGPNRFFVGANDLEKCDILIKGDKFAFRKAHRQKK